MPPARGNVSAAMRRGRPPYPDLLTPREQEVLDLLQRGLTNRQIAERLGISLPGARYHVSEILSKLGVGSRQEAAAWSTAERPSRRWSFAFLTVPLLRLHAATVFKAAAGIVVTGAIVGLLAFAEAVLSTNNHPEAAIPELLPTSTPPSVEVTSQFPAQLLASSRDRLRICVEAVDMPGYNLPAAVNGITAALPELEQHARWAERGYAAGGGPVVGVGCPGDPAALKPGVRIDSAKGAPERAVFVQQASPYLLHVFVVSESRLASAFSQSMAYRQTTEEVLRQGHVGAGVTEGMYLTPAEIQDQGVLVDRLKKGLLLEPTFQPQPDNCRQKDCAP
jgi:DNA-binding CsgD family transcriptional regulator